MILTRPQISAFEKAIAYCNDCLPRLELLEKLAEVNPALKARVDEIRAKRDYLYTLSETALEFDRQMAASR